MDVTQTLAKFASGLNFSSLHENSILQAKKCILDMIGAILAGSTMKNSNIDSLREVVLRSDGQGRSTVIGFGDKTSCEKAAFLNGTMAEIPELIDGHQDTGGHVIVIPAAMALAENEGVSGKDFITSTVVGYEAYIRISSAIHPSTTLLGFLTTGTCGPLGAALACGKILKFEEEDMANALGIAGFLAPVTLLETFFDTIKPTHGGQAAKVGVLAALLTEKEFTASHRILEGNAFQSGFCKAISREIDIAKVVDGIGKEYRMMDVYFKPYASCRLTHSAIDGVLELVRNYDLKPGNVDSITVETSKVAKALVDRYTSIHSNFVFAQHSLPYVIAVALMDGEVGVKQFSEPRIKDPAIHELARKVEVAYDPQLEFHYPDSHYYACRLDVITKKGRYKKFVRFPRGDPKNPLSDLELTDKFRKLASLVLERGKVEKIVEMIANLEKLESLTELTSLLYP